MRLVLVRHATVEDSALGRCYGTLDVALSAAGRSEAAALAATLSSERIQAVVSSPRARSVETAKAIAHAHGLEVQQEPRLCELDFGELEGRTYDELAASMPELYAEWMSTPTTVQFPGGESYADLHARALAAVEAIREAHDGETVVAVTHGGVVRAVLREVLGVPAARIFRIAVDPASVSIVEWLGGDPVVLAVNRRL
jgi:alpha-ribazole phosphatase